ncbi:MAG: hypothetical protein ACI9JY_002810, partial [Saprospiraceae bacterium]
MVKLLDKIFSIVKGKIPEKDVYKITQLITRRYFFRAKNEKLMPLSQINRTHAQISRAALQRLYIAMRHLFIRGNYKPLGVSGEAMIEAMMALRPEIYGSIADPERVELSGLLYIFQRLPQGIEECRYIKLISREGYENADFQVLTPSKRRRDCYRIDHEQMFVEMTRGRSDTYDILTHLTFMYIEAEKIRKNSLDSKGRKKRDWEMLEKVVQRMEKGEEFDKQVAYSYLSNILGRTFEETVIACKKFEDAEKVNSIFSITYSLGKLSMEEHLEDIDREISFSSSLRKEIGHHIYGEIWANRIKETIVKNDWTERPVHIISANLHSVLNSIFAVKALEKENPKNTLDDWTAELSREGNYELRDKVRDYALKNGMIELFDISATGITVQVFDMLKVKPANLPAKFLPKKSQKDKKAPVLVVMDYAFGEQAFETLDELLKPYDSETGKVPLQIKSVNIMGKAGILEGGKGDIMIPTAHVFEGTADNYPFENALKKADFENQGLGVYEGPLITVLGTSLQNRDILRYFLKSSWRAIGLEMEGAHYQKAIQAASKIRNSVSKDLVVRYAYYASDNPLETGSTLASGSLGFDGVKPTYLITE